MTLLAFFKENPKAALGFSGGVDSSYLLYAGVQAGADIHPYYIKTAFQPQFELDDAERLCAQLGVPLTVLELDVLKNEAVTANPPDRYTLLLDGTNASDDAGERPGMRALKELHVCSPLRECGLTKAEIRRLSREAGLFTWDKPAYACLATRIPSGDAITAEKLLATERAEAVLFSLGLTDFRVRNYRGAARLQFPEAQLNAVLAHRAEILQELKKDYPAVLLDLEVRG